MRSRVTTIQTQNTLKPQAAYGTELLGISLVWSEVNKSSQVALRDIGIFFFLEKEQGNKTALVTPIKHGADISKTRQQ